MAGCFFLLTPYYTVTIMKFRLLLTAIAILAILFKVQAQDNIYSQFFNAPVYLNPALNGQFKGDFRINAIYRSQWSAVGNLNYFTASADYNIPRFGGGIGMIFTHSVEGAAYLTKNNIAGIYSYSVGSDGYVLSFGLQAGVTNRQVDWSKLVFADQIDPRLGYIPGSGTSAELPAFNSRYYFDSGAGVNLVVNNFMGGLALQHLNRPDESFTGTPSIVPMRLTNHVSYRIDLNPYDGYDDNEKTFAIPSVVFYKQGTSNTINAGVQYKRRSINAGIWYRTDSQGGSNAVVVSLIFDMFVNKETGEKFRFGLSHDANTSRIGYGSTSGSTEGSISYETPVTNYSSYNKFDGATRCYNFF